jgi:hypothetical protein
MPFLRGSVAGVTDRRAHAMPRPRKNRVGEYAGLLGEELQVQLAAEVRRAVRDADRPWLEAIAALRAEIAQLRRRVAELSRRPVLAKRTVGRWVPGGPGRPPKDAPARIAAFQTRRRKR